MVLESKIFKSLTPKQRVLKNFIALSVTFLLIFASVDDISSVASILNQNEGLGNTSQAIIYVFQLIFSFVWPQLTIELLGFKKALILAEICYLMFFIANTFPMWYTLVPTSILAGYANCQAWTTLGIYFTILSKKYARIENIEFVDAQTMLFGWFGCIFFINRIIGSSWIAGILQLRELSVNSTFNYAENCGANNYPQTKLPEATSKPSVQSVYILCATLVASCLLAILVTFLFVDDIKEDMSDELAKREKLSFQLIGWCIMVYAVTACIVSYLISRLAKHIGVQTTIVMMLLAALSQAIFMLSWTPDVNTSYVIFLMAATFGFTQSLANTQIRAAFGLFFPKDPTAYSGAILSETMGFIIGSILSIFFQTRIKIYVYIGIIFSSVATYVWLEVRHRNKLATQSEMKLVNVNGQSSIDLELYVAKE